MRMKKVLVLLLVLVLAFSVVACGGETSTDESKTGEEVTDEPTENAEESNEVEAYIEDKSDTESEETSEIETETTLGTEFKTGPYTVKVNSVRRGKDYEGNDVVIINYNWTNNSEDTTSWMGSMMTQVFQDGVELEHAIMMEGINTDLSLKEVRPGTTLEGIEEAFVTTSENPLEIEVVALEELFTGEPVLIITEYPAE